MTRLARFKHSIDEWGFARATWAGLMNRVRSRFMLCQVQIRPNEAVECSVQPGDDIEIRLATQEELHRAAAHNPDQLTDDFIHAALSRGELCAAAFAGAKVVSSQWAAFTTANVNDALEVRFEAPYRYGYKGYTHPDYRGRRIAQRVMRFCDEECLTRGYTHTIVYVETHNYASLANLRRLGNRCVGYAGYVRVGGSYIPFRTPGAKRHAFGFYRAISEKS